MEHHFSHQQHKDYRLISRVTQGSAAILSHLNYKAKTRMDSLFSEVQIVSNCSSVSLNYFACKRIWQCFEVLDIDHGGYSASAYTEESETQGKKMGKDRR